MKTRILIFLVLGIISGARSQNTINLTFTAVNNASSIRLDSIKVMNRTRGDSVKLYWPDTTLTYQIIPGDLLLYIGYAMSYPAGVGSLTKGEKKFQLYQSYPNPVRDQAVISVNLPSRGPVDMMVTDVRGRIALNVNRELDKGIHSFRLRPGDERIYFFTAQWNGITQSIKILTEGPTGGKTCKLEYIGPDHENPSLKQSQLKASLVVQESGILDTPDHDTAYTFQFATNIPCPGTPTVTYEGQVYNTIQIFSQCWLKENLNVGTMIMSPQNPDNNGIIEKYCVDNNPDSCAKYGGLYQWDETMLYTNQQGACGICPPGWHLPTDEEWKLLAGAVDSQCGIGDNVWDELGNKYRGYDAGTNLKTTNGWDYNGNGTDLFGFSGMPGGDHYTDGSFIDVGEEGNWWSSTVGDGNGRTFRLISENPGVFLAEIFLTWGYRHNSARCIRDY